MLCIVGRLWYLFQLTNYDFSNPRLVKKSLKQFSFNKTNLQIYFNLTSTKDVCIDRQVLYTVQYLHNVQNLCTRLEKVAGLK